MLSNETLAPVYIVEIILASISILGSIFILFVFFCFKDLRTWAFELVALLAFSSIINSFSYIFYYFDSGTSDIDKNKCYAQAFLMVWFENSQFIWAMLIGFSIYESIVLSKEEEEVTARKRICYFFIAFVIPLLFSIFTYTYNFLGPMGNWCWIGEYKDVPTTEYFDLSTRNFTIAYMRNLNPMKKPFNITGDSKFYKKIYLSLGVRVAAGLLIGFNIIILLLNWYFIISTIRSLNVQFSSPEEKRIVSGYISKISLFPLIQTICMFPSYVNKFFIFFELEFHWLNIVQTIFCCSQGLLYALVYGCNTKVKKALKETAKRTLCCEEEPNRISIVSDESLNKSDRRIEALDDYKI